MQAPFAAGDAQNAGTNHLQNALVTHRLDESIQLAPVAGDLDGVVSTETLAGYPVLFDLSAGAMINSSNITVTDIYTRNGVIHVIDAVLLPPEGDIVETAVAAGFSTLAAALEAGELVSALQGEGPFTVFAPTDDAFAKLPAGTLEDLLKPENKSKLQEILTYHVVSGKYMAKDVVSMKEAKTVNGQSFMIRMDAGSVFVDNAKVVKTDIECSNGVVHVIDSVILPK